jgi:hypothetical protein
MDGKDGSYAVVECADQQLAITRNGQLVGKRRWLPVESERCLNTLFQLAGHMPGENLDGDGESAAGA